jgi:hypothetical protein
MRAMPPPSGGSAGVMVVVLALAGVSVLDTRGPAMAERGISTEAASPASAWPGSGVTLS